MVTPIDTQRYKVIADPLKLFPGTGPVQVQNIPNPGDPYGVDPLRVIFYEPIAAPAGGLEVANGVYQVPIEAQAVMAANFLWKDFFYGANQNLYYGWVQDSEGQNIINHNHKPLAAWINNGSGQPAEVKIFIRLVDTAGGMFTFYDGLTVFPLNMGENQCIFPNAPVMAFNSPTGFGLQVTLSVRFAAGAVPLIHTFRAILSAGLPLNG